MPMWPAGQCEIHRRARDRPGRGASSSSSASSSDDPR
jgi:hypothetical protein